MRINITQLGIMIMLAIIAWLTAIFDNIMMQFDFSFLTLFPFLLLSLYFFTRYNGNRWMFISVFVFFYLLIFIIPIWLGLIIVLSIFGIEKILGFVLQRFNIVQVLVVTIFIMLLLSFVYEYQINFLSWNFVQTTWSIKDMHEYVIRIILGVIFGIILYPVLSVYESKHKLYLSSY